MVLRRYLANTQEHMQWKEADWDKYLLQQIPTSWQQWYMEENQKWKLLWKMITEFQTGSEKEFGDYLFVILKK